MAGAQLENGYTKIANEILEQIARTDLNGTQFKIIMVIFRYTYGFNRKEHDLSISFIAKATNVHKKQIQRELNALIEKNIVSVISEATFNKTRTIAFNKSYIEWVLNNRVVTKTLPPNEIDTHTGSELATTTGNELAPQERKKENIKETIYSVFDNYSENLDLRQALRDYSVMRNKIKAPLTNRAVDMLLNKLDSLASTDETKVKILEQSILSNWKSVYPLKQDQVQQPKQQQSKPNKFHNFIQSDNNINLDKFAELKREKFFKEKTGGK